MENNLRVGQTVFLVGKNSRGYFTDDTQILKRTITDIGKKYFTVNDIGRNDQFEIRTLVHKGSKDFGASYQLYLSREEIIAGREERKCIREIKKCVMTLKEGDLSIDALAVILNTIKGHAVL